jgi:hypothetical protein
MTKTLQTLPADIDELFFKGKDIDDAALNLFLSNIGNILKERLRPKSQEAPTIRMSKLGIPDRKLWYEHNDVLVKTSSANALKFVYGDIIEQLIIFLAKEAGHLVEDEQKEVEIDGIKGHQDCKMDGVTVDIKSASSFAFRKFSERKLFQDDPFGYVAQLSAYKSAAKTTEAAFVGVNKETGQICILPLEGTDGIDPNARIKRVKEVVALKEPPPKKCYEPIPYKGSSNMTLNKNCTYCPYAHKCWSDANNGAGLRYFQYANEVVALTSVVTTPRVDELPFNGLANGELEESKEAKLSSTANGETK